MAIIFIFKVEPAQEKRIPFYVPFSLELNNQAKRFKWFIAQELMNNLVMAQKVEKKLNILKTTRLLHLEERQKLVRVMEKSFKMNYLKLNFKIKVPFHFQLMTSKFMLMQRGSVLTIIVNIFVKARKQT